MTVSGGVWMAAGLVVGGLGVAFVGRFLRTQLFGVPELDPVEMVELPETERGVRGFGSSKT